MRLYNLFAMHKEVNRINMNAMHARYQYIVGQGLQKWQSEPMTTPAQNVKDKMK